MVEEFFVVLNYKFNLSLGFSPSQRWRSTAGKDAFPYCKLQRAQINGMRDKWRNIDSLEDIMAKFLNFYCLETNVIEGTMKFDSAVSSSFIHCTPRAGVLYFLPRLQLD